MDTKPSFKVSPGVTVPSGTSNTNSYSSTGLDPSTRYYYRIAAVDDANNIGPLSNTKSGMTKGAATSIQNNNSTQELTGLSSSSTMTTSSADTSPPAQVTGLIIRTLSSTQLYLTWTRVSASDFNHYNIYRGTSGFTVTPGVTVPTGTSTTSSYSNTGLSPSTTYSYRVAAVDNAGNIGALSSQVSKTTAASTSSTDRTPPAQVTGLVITTVSSSQLNLAWTQVSASDFNHYNIYRGTSGFTVTPGVTVPTGTSTTSSYSNTGLSPSTTYSYRVAAVDNAGNIGALSSQVSKTTAASTSSTDRTPPAQVTGLVITTVSSSQLNLAWTQVSASDFNHYNIYRGTSGFTVTPGVTVPTGTSTTSSYSNTGLSPSTTYSYRVAAVDNAGNIGALSSQVSKTTAASTSSTDRTPPAQVTGLVITTVSSSQLNLAWTQVSASDFNHYNIYRGTSPNFAVSLGITLPLGTSTANSYSSTGLNPSTTYYYKVAAVDNTGNIGALSTEKSATTAATTSSTGNVYDDFQGGTYKLTDGQKSPNGKWVSKWNAGGEMGVKTENGNNVFYGFPRTATSPGQTSSSFALSTQKFSDMTLELDMKTYKQLRQNSAPNTWETAWVMWRWTDLFHHYYFVIKTNGIEFGKKDTSCSCEQQVFLKTGSSPKLSLGTWDHIKISSIGKHTTIWVDGTKVVDMDDPSYSSTADMSSGYIGLYNEDASSAFDKVTVTPQ